MQTPKLFTLLPEAYVATPDGMAVSPGGDLILACPNFADLSLPGCLVKIDKDKNVSKWLEIPVEPQTGCSRPMGLEFGPDGDVYVCDNVGWDLEKTDLHYKGRMLRIRMDGDHMVKFTVVATGIEHPNGVRIQGDHLYVTNSVMMKVKDESGLMVSSVYRFHLDDENVQVHNTLDDENLIATFLTKNPVCQYGADGIEFDNDGNLYVGNFGDGEINKITFDADGNVTSNEVWAKDPDNLKTTDGMISDKKGAFYMADFGANAVAKIDWADGKVTRICQSPDCDGFDGQLDQPGEPVIWNGKIVVSCFDSVTGHEYFNNSAHELPCTMAELALE